MSYYDPNANPPPSQGGYGQSGYGQSGYGQGSSQGSYGQGGYSQGGYDQGEYDQGEYDQGEYDQGEYDQQQAGYQPPPYPQQPSYPAPQAYPGPGGSPGQVFTTPHRQWLPLIIGGVVLVVLLCCVLPIGYLAFSSRGGGTTSPRGTPTVSGTATPAQQVVYQNTFKTADDGHWPNDNRCGLQTDGYHVTSVVTCLTSGVAAIGDGTISVDVVQLSGAANQPHGIAFHRASANRYYVFGIDANGEWYFQKYLGTQAPQALVDFTANAAIKKGLNVTNHLTVRMTGSRYDFLVNNANVGSLTDSSYPSGIPGLTGNTGVELVYTNFVMSQPVASSTSAATEHA